MSQQIDPHADNQAQADDVTPDQSSPDNRRAVEELTLAELLANWVRRPRQTTEAFLNVVQSDATSSYMLNVDSDSEQLDEEQSERQAINAIRNFLLNNRLFWYGLAFTFALVGNTILAGDIGARRTEDVQLVAGTPYLVLAVVIWIIADVIFNQSSIREWWQNRQSAQKRKDSSQSDDERQTERIIYPRLVDRIPLWRFPLALIAVIASTVTYIYTQGNTFRTIAFIAWIISIITWSIVFSPIGFNLLDWLRDKRQQSQTVDWQSYTWVIMSLVVIISVATWFRFYQLDIHPLEMTDDHVEKILDAGRVRDGGRDIFFANNGGREPLQMYLIALVSQLPNFGINHDTIKFVSATESLLTIPALFWMGYALLEGESKRRRLLVGLILAGLVAVSYWHVVITRQGLRIPLTALVVSLQMIYLMRAVRHNRRSDYIISGLILGFGLYTYQAVRMLPVVIVVAIGFAIIFNAKTWRDRLHYVLNLSVLVAMSFIVFIPMFRYSVDFSELFWRRTTGRLLGDDVIQEIGADGQVYYRDATVEERFDAFTSNIPQLTQNIRNVLLMFNWEGDVATISGVSNRPAMDVWASSLLIVGLGAWTIFAIRKRDTVYWLIPVVTFLMLLPSALSIAAPHENPSHTRTSGAIPTVYLIASLPLALILERLLDGLRGWHGKALATGLAIVVIGASFNANRYLYFEVYPERYQASFNPYSEAGRYLYGYVLTGGAYGNSFLIGYEHWWSHRAIGLEGGLEEFWTGGVFPYVNGQYSTTPIIQAILANLDQTGTMQFRPDADLLFFYSPNDTDTEMALRELFPNGIAVERQTYNPNESFMVYEVPALGVDGLQTFLVENAINE
ncbi:MAG: glucosyltransferase domain-containing protein [Chloroflexota bacterium]